MSDFEKMKEILSHAEVSFSESIRFFEGDEKNFKLLTLEANTAGIDGYGGFQTEFAFNPDGSLYRVSISE